ERCRSPATTSYVLKRTYAPAKLDGPHRCGWPASESSARRQRSATVKSPNKNFLAGDKAEKRNRPFPSERRLWLIGFEASEPSVKLIMRIDDSCASAARFD